LCQENPVDQSPERQAFGSSSVDLHELDDLGEFDDFHKFNFVGCLEDVVLETDCSEEGIRGVPQRVLSFEWGSVMFFRIDFQELKLVRVEGVVVELFVLPIEHCVEDCTGSIVYNQLDDFFFRCSSF
jgi:hypothetical protein